LSFFINSFSCREREVESVKRRIEDEKKELQLSIDRYSQKESKRGIENVVFARQKRIQERRRTCRLCSFQRESKRGAGHNVFVHSKENPRGV
jgi:hypothetical protein